MHPCYWSTSINHSLEYPCATVLTLWMPKQSVREHLFYIGIAAPFLQGEAASSRPTLLFLHGFLGRAADWEACMDSLATTFRCVAVDLPGHGATQVHAQPGSTAFSLEAVTDALAGLIAQLEMDSTPHGCVVVGYSLGARLALRMALVHGQDAEHGVVQRSVVVSGSPGLRSEAAREVRWPRLRASKCLDCFVNRRFLKPFAFRDPMSGGLDGREAAWFTGGPTIESLCWMFWSRSCTSQRQHRLAVRFQLASDHTCLYKRHNIWWLESL